MLVCILDGRFWKFLTCEFTHKIDQWSNATKTGLYYLCMFSAMTSTYSVLIKETPVNAAYHFLDRMGGTNKEKFEP
jgi:hypothetical protein